MSASALPPIERVLFTEQQVNDRVQEVAAAISEKYSGRDLKMIGVMKGSVYFLTALTRALTIPVKIDFLAISSFASTRNSPGVVRIAKDLDEPIEGEDILLVEDIVDTGLTARYLLQTLAGRAPNSLGIVTMLDRTSRRLVSLPIEFRGFEIPDYFVIGCGLDFKQRYRNLPYIAVMKQGA